MLQYYHFIILFVVIYCSHKIHKRRSGSALALLWSAWHWQNQHYSGLCQTTLHTYTVLFNGKTKLTTIVVLMFITQLKIQFIIGAWTQCIRRERYWHCKRANIDIRKYSYDIQQGLQAYYTRWGWCDDNGCPKCT